MFTWSVWYVVHCVSSCECVKTAESRRIQQ